jgi:hypothetical protein
MDKFKEIVAKLWKAAVIVLKKVFSPFLDAEWDPDPYKIGGFGCFGIALWLAVQVIDLAKAMLAAGKLDAAVFAAAAGLVGTVIGIGSFLFAQGRQADNDLKKPAPAAGPAPTRAAPAAPETAQG